MDIFFKKYLNYYLEIKKQIDDQNSTNNNVNSNNKKNNERYQDDVFEDSVSLDDFGKDGKLKNNVKQQHKDDEINENDEFELDFALEDNKINLNLDKNKNNNQDNIYNNHLNSYKNNFKNSDDDCNVENGIFSEDDPFKDVGNIIEDLSSKKTKVTTD